MKIIVSVIAILVAIEHLYIMYIETIATTSKTTSRTFGIMASKLKEKEVALLLKNQGVYNALIAVLIIIAVVTGNLLWTQLLLGYVILVAIYGGLTSDPGIIVKQAGLAIIGLVLSLLL